MLLRRVKSHSKRMKHDAIGSNKSRNLAWNITIQQACFVIEDPRLALATLRVARNEIFGFTKLATLLQQFLHSRNDCFRGDPEFLHHNVAGCGCAEMVDADRDAMVADVPAPAFRDSSFDGNTLCNGRG